MVTYPWKNTLDKQNILFTKFLVLVTEHPEFLGSGKDDKYFVYAVELEVLPKRNLEGELVWLISILFFHIFTKILFKPFSLEISLGLFELVYSASLILFWIIFWEFTVFENWNFLIFVLYLREKKRK